MSTKGNLKQNKNRNQGKKISQNQKGFTLVEIAIVLVIIGLLLGGVIKGREMIANTKFKKMIKFIDEMSTAIYLYQDKYGVMPGDDPNAKANLAGGVGGCASDDIVNGDGNGGVYSDKGEHLALTQHLSCANLIKGNFDGTSTILKSPYGGTIHVIHNTVQGYSGHCLYFHWLTPELAKRIDEAIDDGKFNSGMVRATGDYDGFEDLAVFL